MKAGTCNVIKRNISNVTVLLVHSTKGNHHVASLTEFVLLSRQKFPGLF